MRHSGALRWLFGHSDFARSLCRVVKFAFGVLMWVIAFGGVLLIGMLLGVALRALTGDSD